MTRRVAIVPHTHWDREWYQPFQAFRLRLVDVVDGLLELLDADQSYSRFLLDGQLAAVDDYLEIRPEAEGRLRSLVESGRVAVGPWYVLPDEFLVSGETLVRNLEAGLARAADLGGAMEVGYLPDMFGHVAQMPQLLRQAGFDHAVVWRGVPSAVDRTAFRWRAPDGSTVRAEYLPVGYGNGAAVPDDAAQLVSRIAAHDAELGALLAPDGPMLWMNGTDHQAPQPWLGRVVGEANEAQDRYRLAITSLAEYLPGAPVEGLPEWTGELRSGARANLLMGVASNRLDVKQAAAAAERSLERRAEPLCALFLPPDRWPGAALGIAWKHVLRNAAHDSICACSADEVVAAVLHRYAEARQVGDGLAARAVSHVGASLPAGPAAVNPSARTRSGLVELTTAGERRGDSARQVLWSRPASIERHVLPGSEVGGLLSQVANDAFADGARISRVGVIEGSPNADPALEVMVRTGVGADADATIATAAALCDVYARAGAHHDDMVAVTVRHRPIQRVLARAVDVAGFGWRSLGAAEQVAPVTVSAAGGTLVMANGLVRVEVDEADGTLSVDGFAGLNRLVDGGDAGDTYNYSPPPADCEVDRPDQTTVTAVERGPLRATVSVVRRYTWPAAVVDGERAGEQPVDVESLVSLHAAERLVRVTTILENRCRHHRLRALFPLPERAATSRAECAFAVVERGLDAEGGPHERALPTFPSRRFVSAGGLTVVHDGLPEYELVDGGAALALTLLRCVGVLSGTYLAYRPRPAGPPIAVEGAQMQGRRAFRYGIVVGDCDPYAAADDAFLPLEPVMATGPATASPTGQALRISGVEVSSVRRVGGELEVRVFNPTATAVTVELPGRRGTLVDLRGRPVDRFDNSFDLAPWRIATARLGS